MTQEEDCLQAVRWHTYRTSEYLTVQLDTFENTVNERDNYP